MSSSNVDLGATLTFSFSVDNTNVPSSLSYQSVTCQLTATCAVPSSSLSSLSFQAVGAGTFVLSVTATVTLGGDFAQATAEITIAVSAPPGGDVDPGLPPVISFLYEPVRISVGVARPIFARITTFAGIRKVVLQSYFPTAYFTFTVPTGPGSETFTHGALGDIGIWMSGNYEALSAALASVYIQPDDSSGVIRWDSFSAACVEEPPMDEEGNIPESCTDYITNFVMAIEDSSAMTADIAVGYFVTPVDGSASSNVISDVVVAPGNTNEQSTFTVSSVEGTISSPDAPATVHKTRAKLFVNGVNWIQVAPKQLIFSAASAAAQEVLRDIVYVAPNYKAVDLVTIVVAQGTSTSTRSIPLSVSCPLSSASLQPLTCVSAKAQFPEITCNPSAAASSSSVNYCLGTSSAATPFVFVSVPPSDVIAATNPAGQAPNLQPGDSYVDTLGSMRQLDCSCSVLSAATASRSLVRALAADTTSVQDTLTQGATKFYSYTCPSSCSAHFQGNVIGFSTRRTATSTTTTPNAASRTQSLRLTSGEWVLTVVPSQTLLSQPAAFTMTLTITSTTTSNSLSAPENSSSSASGAIAAGVVVPIVLIAIVIAVCCAYRRKNTKRDKIVAVAVPTSSRAPSPRHSPEASPRVFSSITPSTTSPVTSSRSPIAFTFDTSFSTSNCTSPSSAEQDDFVLPVTPRFGEDETVTFTIRSPPNVKTESSDDAIVPLDD
jgi:hypothetical protein